MTGGFDLPIGTIDDARAMIGRSAPTRFAPGPVNLAMIRHYCGLVQDPNPEYWDEQFSVARWGGQISPPAMTMIWLQPLQWTPEGGETNGTPSLAPNVPLPGNTLINVSTDTYFFRPVFTGMHLNITETLIDISEPKTTRLGEGHFLTTEPVYRTEDGDEVARSRNILFRYEPARGAASEVGA